MKGDQNVKHIKEHKKTIKAVFNLKQNLDDFCIRNFLFPDSSCQKIKLLKVKFLKFP